VRPGGTNRAAWSRLAAVCAVACALGLGAARVRAQDAAAPYVPLESQLLLQARPEQGLLVLHSGYRNHEWVDADAVVWLGAGEEREADVLSASVGFREPRGIGQGRLGRFVLATGAVRPVHIDGAIVMGRVPAGASVELFAGMPVVPEFGERDFDWLVGGRLAQRLFSERFGLGVSYLHRRDAGQIASEEAGADLSLRPLDWLTLSAVTAWDVVHRGLADARISLRAQQREVVVELFGSRRVAAWLLPATSLFSTISDARSQELGTDVTWYAFPRLDLGGVVALEAADGDLGYRAELRGRLRLDPEGHGELWAAASRRELDAAAWSGARIAIVAPLARRLRANAGIELVAPDHPAQDGELWPWARLGASYALTDHWLLAAALEGKATPTYRRELTGLLRVSYAARVEP